MRYIPHRLAYLDGLRGIAAWQVVFLHVFSAFVPSIVFDSDHAGPVAGFIRTSPLSFIYWGYAAVFIFFLLSGYVLTNAFAHANAPWFKTILARVARLWIPATAFGAIACVVLMLFPESHTVLGHTLNSQFLLNSWNADMSVSGIARDILLSPVFTGYMGVHADPSSHVASAFQPSISVAMNAPVWSLSQEMLGSVIVFLLVTLRGRQQRLWLVALCVLMFALPPGFQCFLIGHVAAVLGLAEQGIFDQSRRARLVPLTILGCGIAVTTSAPGYDAAFVIGVTMVFLGAILSPDARIVLASRFPRRLGHLSFTIYLLHWPVIFGPGTWLVRQAIPLAGPELSIAAIIPVLVFTIYWLATGAVVIDDFATRVAQRIKSGTSLLQASVLLPSRARAS